MLRLLSDLTGAADVKAFAVSDRRRAVAQLVFGGEKRPDKESARQLAQGFIAHELTSKGSRVYVAIPLGHSQCGAEGVSAESCEKIHDAFGEGVDWCDFTLAL